MPESERAAVAERIVATMRDVPDFPAPGILFKDITPVLANPVLMADAVRAMAQPFIDLGITHVVGIESRGFLFGMPLALHLGTAFAPARKPGKLPWKTIRETYALEYGADALELHADAVGALSRVLVVDDLLATGGTAAAASRLVKRLGATVVGLSVLTELSFLHGRERLGGMFVSSLVRI
jgi:adenine phosphoribosyltransferase